MSASLVIQNPKRDNESRSGSASWYPYYAGFSPAFARKAIESAGLCPESHIGDPWNGSGTTTTIAAELGFSAYGFDLNPVMVIAAKARALSLRETPSLWPIAVDILKKAENLFHITSIVDDPLSTWFRTKTVHNIRNVEGAIQLLLVDAEKYQSLLYRNNFNGISDLAAFYYVALFRTVRSLLTTFFTSNPTWTKKPKNEAQLLEVPAESIAEAFKQEVLGMVATLREVVSEIACVHGEIQLGVASSEALPLINHAVDFILTSPPYCTRIDYAVATMPELAILGYSLEGDFEELRRRLIGTSTVPKASPTVESVWGDTCCKFLFRLQSHESKASKTYYYKNHLQYFEAMFKSMAELRRILKPGGTCVMVVQDSYYKEIHNDLPQILIEMGNANSLHLTRREDFGHNKNMAKINPRAKNYRQTFRAMESVLCFS